MADPPINKQKKPNQTPDDRKRVCTFYGFNIKEGSNPPQLKHGAIAGAAKKFNISRVHAGRIWKQARENLIHHDMSTKSEIFLSKV